MRTFAIDKVIKAECCILFSSEKPAVSVPPQENKTGPWTQSSSVPIPSSPVQLPTWHRTNSTSSCWSEARACWLVLPFFSNIFVSVVPRTVDNVITIQNKWVNGFNREGHIHTKGIEEGLNLLYGTWKKHTQIIIWNAWPGSLQHMRNFIFLSFFLSKLIAGLESPTHALRADADPSAQSASATYITLAQEHPYDRHIEIILHLSGEQLQSAPPP